VQRASSSHKTHSLFVVPRRLPLLLRPQVGESWNEICGLEEFIACGENYSLNSAGLFMHHNFSSRKTGPSRRLIRTLFASCPPTLSEGLTCKFFPQSKIDKSSSQPHLSRRLSYVYDLHLMTTLCIAPLLSSCQAFTSVPKYNNTRPGAPLVTACAHGRSDMVKSMSKRTAKCSNVSLLVVPRCRLFQLLVRGLDKPERFTCRGVNFHRSMLAGSDRRALPHDQFFRPGFDSVCSA
jgi:hypothetical protein